MPLRRRLAGPRWEMLVLAVLVAAGWLWFALPAIWSASADARLVGVFDSDEFYHIQLLRTALANHTPAIDWIYYGHFYYNLLLVPLLILQPILPPISDQALIVAMRWLSLVGGLATVLMVFVMARRFFGRLTAWLTALLLATLPLAFLQWSVMSHPDTLQMFLIVAGLYCAARYPDDLNLRWLRLASLFAGLAFSTKYLGLFLMPILWALLAVGVRQTMLPANYRPLSDVRLLRLGTALAGVASLIGGFVFPDLYVRYLDVDGQLAASSLELLKQASLLAKAGGVVFSGLAVLPWLWTWLGRHMKVVYFIRQVAVTSIIFGAAFVVTSPFSLLNFGFLKGLALTSIFTSWGYFSKADTNSWEWVQLLISDRLVGLIWTGLAAAGLAVFIARLIRSRGRLAFSATGISWAWVVFFFLYAVWRVNLRNDRYLLVIAPLVFMLAAHFVVEAARGLTAKLNRPAAQLAAAGLIAVVIIGSVLPATAQTAAFRQESLTREQNSVAVQAGRWLGAQYAPTSRVLYDTYSYVPPEFENVRLTVDVTPEVLQTYQPAVVVVNDAIRLRFADADLAGDYREGAAAYLGAYEFYQLLEHEQAGYVLARDFGPVRIYQRRSGN